VRGALSGEWVKTFKRPSTWVLLALLLAILITLGYFLGWFLLTVVPRRNLGPNTDPVAIKHAYYPINFVRSALGNASLFGAVLALILGVLAVGSEYGWGTFKTILTQRPGRLEVFAAKFAAVVISIVIFGIASFAAAAVCSVLLALIDGKSLQFPDLIHIAAGLGATWLIWCWNAAFGGLLAYLFKQSALAIGIGLAYVFVIETIIFNVLRPLGSVVDTIEKFFPGPNASALVANFGPPAEAGTRAAAPLVGGWQATAVLLVYIVAALGLSALLLRVRDVT
jgi:ABC-2 type transport system permease protein